MDVVAACSILHNMLLDFDGFDIAWKDVLATALQDESDADSEDALHTTTAVMERTQANRSLRRKKLIQVKRADELEGLDPSLSDSLVGPRFGELVVEHEKEDDHFSLRAKLIHSFNIQKALGQVFWLKPPRP